MSGPEPSGGRPPSGVLEAPVHRPLAHAHRVLTENRLRYGRLLEVVERAAVERDV